MGKLKAVGIFFVVCGNENVKTIYKVALHMILTNLQSMIKRDSVMSF